MHGRFYDETTWALERWVKLFGRNLSKYQVMAEFDDNKSSAHCFQHWLSFWQGKKDHVSILSCIQERKTIKKNQPYFL